VEIKMIDDSKERLSVIFDMAARALKENDMLLSTAQLLKDIQSVTNFSPDNSNPKVILSVDASITKNPGGKAVVAWVVEVPGEQPFSESKFVPSKTSNQAEYDAIYEGLVTFFALRNNPGIPVEVHSDSQIAVYQLNNQISCQDETLVRKKDNILELVTALPVNVTFVWRPRCSTNALKLADHMAHSAVALMNEEEK